MGWRIGQLDRLRADEWGNRQGCRASRPSGKWVSGQRGEWADGKNVRNKGRARGRGSSVKGYHRKNAGGRVDKSRDARIKSRHKGRAGQTDRRTNERTGDKQAYRRGGQAANGQRTERQTDRRNDKPRDKERKKSGKSCRSFRT